MINVILLAKILVWPFLLVGMAVNAGGSVLLDSLETKHFSASIACSPLYQTTDDVKCDFHLTNNADRNYAVLTWNTPLEELAPKGLAVTRDEMKLKYDGILLKRGAPGRDAFLTIRPGETVSSKINLSPGYETANPGTYTVAVDTYLEYAEGSVSSLPETGNIGIDTKLAHLSSPATSFQVVGKSSSKRTLGQQARSLEGRN